MKHILHYLALAFLLCVFPFAQANAQSGNWSRFFMFAAKSDPNFARILMQEEAARRTAQSSAKPLEQAEKQLASSSFASRHKRLLWKIQTRLGVSKRQALKNLEKWGAFPYSRPPLKKGFWAKELPAVRLSKLPPPPLAEREGYAYWAGILPPKGLQLAPLLQQTFVHEELFFKPQKALHQALQQTQARAGVPVIIVLRKQAGKTLRYQPIQTFVLLPANNRLSWFSVVTHANGFWLTPEAETSF